ncbi:flavoprotein [Eubacteriaceae bacterium ES3]|nr:flavoprotein [Eubacteriaceae bacterium ES3]
MDMNELLQGSLMDLLVQKVVEEVIRRINAKPQIALVMFTGATIGFKESMDSLSKLQKEGWQLKVVLSDDGMKVQDPEAIKKELNLDTIYHSGNIESQKALYNDVDMMIVATMTINTAAKFANGITDTVLLSLLNHGFMAGVPVVAAKDACDPDNSVRIKAGMGKSTAGYKKMLVSNMDTLTEFGMTLVDAKDLYAACTKTTITEGQAGSVQNEIAEVKNPVSAPVIAGVKQEITLDKKVISRTDILKAREASVIRVPSNAIITDVAAEAIKTFDLKLIRF